MSQSQSDSTQSSTGSWSGELDTSGRESSPASRQVLLPPRWALGYHESYEALPAPDALVTIARRFRNRDTPLESLQLTPSHSHTASTESGIPIDVANQLHDLGIKTPRSIDVSPDDLQTGPVVHEQHHTEYPAGGSRRSRPLLLTRTIGPDTPPHAAVSFPLQLSDWSDLGRALEKCLDVSNRRFPLCGPELHVTDATSASELMVRWIQLAVFLPLLHVLFPEPNLSSDRIWPFDRQVTTVWRRYLGLRYKLLPYLYSMFDQYRRKGLLPLRTVHVNGARSDRHSGQKQFFVGSSMMIAPILEKGKTERPVYFPGDSWFHFWNNRLYEGEQTTIQQAPLARIPVFARGGSVIPLHPYMCYSDSYRSSTLILRTYPRGNRSNEVYLDDGRTFAYTNGDYHRLTIHALQEDNRFSLKIEHDGNRPLPYDHFEWQLPLKRFGSAAVDDRPLDYYDVPERFTAADEGIFEGHYFLRIRTTADLRTLELAST